MGGSESLDRSDWGSWGKRGLFFTTTLRALDGRLPTMDHSLSEGSSDQARRGPGNVKCEMEPRDSSLLGGDRSGISV